MPTLVTIMSAVLGGTVAISQLNDDDYTKSEGLAFDEWEDSEWEEDAAQPFKTAQIDDQGFRMTADWHTVFTHWNVDYELLTDTNTNQPLRNRLDIYGPKMVLKAN